MREHPGPGPGSRSHRAGHADRHSDAHADAYSDQDRRPGPAKTVYVAPAAPALTACGEGTFGEEVYAGPDTSCPFALNVEQAWSQSGATSTFYAYSPVTGLTYLMTSSVSGGLVSATGGNNALVEFTP